MRLSKKWLWIYLYLENFDIPGIILQRRYPEINGQNIWKKFVTKITFNSNVAIKNAVVLRVISSDFGEQFFCLIF